MSGGDSAAETPQISIILPVYDEEEYLSEIVGSYSSVLERLQRSYELLLVTNGCRDRSPEIARTLADGDPRIRAIDLVQGGWGKAVRTGLRASRGESICYTNLARTSAQTLGLLLAYHIAFPDAVLKASRRVRDSWRRRLGSLIYNFECRALFNTAVWDVNGTPKVFPRSCEKLIELQREDDLIDAEFVMRCGTENYNVVEVPILPTIRHGGRSTTNYGSAVHMYVGAVALWASERRR